MDPSFHMQDYHTNAPTLSLSLLPKLKSFSQVWNRAQKEGRHYVLGSNLVGKYQFYKMNIQHPKKTANMVEFVWVDVMLSEPMQ